MVSENRSIPCRVLICFLALLVFFWAVIPPLASATEVVATAAVVGIGPVAAIAGILLCLGVAYVGSGGFDDLVDTLICPFFESENGYPKHTVKTFFEGPNPFLRFGSFFAK